MSQRVSPPLKWHGGKSYLAPMIHALAAPSKHHPKSKPDGWLHRVIPFAGGLGEFWNWDYEGVSEVVNDLDSTLTGFWRVLQRRESFEEFQRIVQCVPFSQEEWRVGSSMAGLNQEKAMGRVQAHNDVWRAVWFFINIRQSLAGRRDSFAPRSRTRTRSGMNEQVSAWLNAVEGLPEAHARLMRVLILNMSAVDVIQKEDGPNTLFYCDPPYIPSTRQSPDVYTHEMTLEQHEELLKALLSCRGRVLLSSYDNELYNDLLKGWSKHLYELPNNAAGGATKRRMQEVIYTNLPPSELPGVYLN